MHLLMPFDLFSVCLAFFEVLFRQRSVFLCDCEDWPFNKRSVVAVQSGNAQSFKKILPTANEEMLISCNFVFFSPRLIFVSLSAELHLVHLQRIDGILEADITNHHGVLRAVHWVESSDCISFPCSHGLKPHALGTIEMTTGLLMFSLGFRHVYSVYR